ncbi:MAG: hypothetical protein ACT443_01345 [Gemmatimonadota bacterium]
MKRLSFALLLFLLGCSDLVEVPAGPDEPGPPNPPPPPVGTERIALTDLSIGNYLGFPGGLYPAGSNTPSAEHAAMGMARAAQIRPRNASGAPSNRGKYVLLSIGMSNTTQEFCSPEPQMACNSWTFMGKAAVDPAVNHTTLAIVNGASGGQTADTWDARTDPNYDLVRNTQLTPRGLTENQVQIVWMKLAHRQPTVSLPSLSSDAYQLVRAQGAVLRALEQRYPNLQQVFISSRTYAGYAVTALNPEPYAYESGFAVKWTIEAQIEEMAGAAPDAFAGSLDSNTVAPWVAWGPYLWANGTDTRTDGLLWQPVDFSQDGTHPSQSGEGKVGSLLLDFFKTSSFTKCWFLAGQTC